MRNINACKNLEPTVSGRVLINKINQDRITSIFDLIDRYNCINCVNKNHCKLIEILESQICL